jgi:hypothetical protein
MCEFTVTYELDEQRYLEVKQMADERGINVESFFRHMMTTSAGHNIGETLHSFRKIQECIKTRQSKLNAESAAESISEAASQR